MLKGWTSSASLVRSWKFQTGAQTDKIAILNSVWEREMGHMAQHWKLSGVKKGVLYVVPKSPAAAMELQMRAPSVLRSINKYFRSAWIKAIKPAAR